jgi:hypothetical protein
MADIRKPVPGDVTTEPVATAEQSHVDGRVGPPTIAQDATAEGFVPKGVEQVEPGQVLPADFPWEGGVVELEDGDEVEVKADSVPANQTPQSQKAGPVVNNHPVATKSENPAPPASAL